VIAIVDYGMGNLRNVHRAFEQIGHSAVVTNERSLIERADRIVLPGVGAFGEAVRRIDALGLRDPLVHHVECGRPLIGICLGLQLLFEKSEESSGAAGLGILHGVVRRFIGSQKVPHIGWNDVVPIKSSSLFADAEPRGAGCFYFVHSFYVAAPPVEVAVTEYGVTFSSAIQHENVVGVQFHPEKSQAAGLELLKHFAEM
jgi:imidazole glycerol-phosphate synthase subunit HisH